MIRIGTFTASGAVASLNDQVADEEGGIDPQNALLEIVPAAFALKITSGDQETADDEEPVDGDVPQRQRPREAIENIPIRVAIIYRARMREYNQAGENPPHQIEAVSIHNVIHDPHRLSLH